MCITILNKSDCYLPPAPKECTYKRKFGLLVSIVIFSVHTTSWQAGIGALHRPEGRHFIRSAPIKLFPLLQEKVTSVLSPVDVSSERLSPAVRIICGHFTFKRVSAESMNKKNYTNISTFNIILEILFN